MISAYRTLVDVESLEVLLKTGKRREKVMRSLIDLATLREEGNGRTVRDPLTRMHYQISRVEGYTITW